MHDEVSPRGRQSRQLYTLGPRASETLLPVLTNEAVIPDVRRVSDDGVDWRQMGRMDVEEVRRDHPGGGSERACLQGLSWIALHPDEPVGEIVNPERGEPLGDRGDKGSVPA